MKTRNILKERYKSPEQRQKKNIHELILMHLLIKRIKYQESSR